MHPCLSPLPLNDVSDLLDGGKQLGKVLRSVGSPGGRRADLQLTKTALQLIDGFSERKLVAHLLDGLDEAHAELGEVLPGLQHGTVAPGLLRDPSDRGSQNIGAVQDHLTRDARVGESLRRLARFPQRTASRYERNEVRSRVSGSRSHSRKLSTRSSRRGFSGRNFRGVFSQFLGTFLGKTSLA